MLERVPYTVVGVMPSGFTVPNRGPVINQTPADLYVPIAFSQRERQAFGSMYNNSVVARLKPGVSVAQADSEVRSIVSRFVAEIYPAVLAGLPIRRPRRRFARNGRTVSTLLFVIFGAGMVVLLIASAVNRELMLTRARRTPPGNGGPRGAWRQRMGRSVRRWSNRRCCTLRRSGGAGAHLLGDLEVVALAPPTIPRLKEVGIDWRVAGFSMAMSLLRH